MLSLRGAGSVSLKSLQKTFMRRLLCVAKKFMAQKWTIWFIIVGNELNVDWMSFPSHLGKLLSIMRQRVRAWVNTRWSEWKRMADFLCSCRDLNLCISHRADLKLPTSRISNEILLTLFYTHSTPTPHHPPVDHQRSSKISRELCSCRVLKPHIFFQILLDDLDGHGQRHRPEFEDIRST